MVSAVLYGVLGSSLRVLIPEGLSFFILVLLLSCVVL